MGTENKGIANILGVIALAFLVLLIVGYAVGKA
jgi:hypothetical protein